MKIRKKTLFDVLGNKSLINHKHSSTYIKNFKIPESIENKFIEILSGIIRNNKGWRGVTDKDIKLKLAKKLNDWWINIGGYSGNLNPPERKILRKIIDLLYEKNTKLSDIKFETNDNNINENNMKTEKIKLSELRNIVRKVIKEQYEDENFNTDDDFVVHGVFTVSNAGGFEIMLSSDGEGAKIRNTESGEISDWFEIEFVPDEESETLEMIGVIDPQGYNIPLNQVMRAQR